MVERPDRTELLGLVGLVVGFVTFTFGFIVYFGGRHESAVVLQIVAGGLIGFAAAAFLVIHYHAVHITGS